TGNGGSGTPGQLYRHPPGMHTVGDLLAPYSAVSSRKTLEQPARNRIALRVDKRIVQRLGSLCYFEESCRLHKCGSADAWYLFQLLSRSKGTMLPTIRYDIIGYPAADPRDIT